MNGIDILKDRGFKAFSNLNYCTENGIDYYIGCNKNTAAIVALIEDANNFLLEKSDLREMALTAKTKGVNTVYLYTNYGCEIHTKYEKPSIVGINRIIKINAEGFNY